MLALPLTLASILAADPSAAAPAPVPSPTPADSVVAAAFGKDIGTNREDLKGAASTSTLGPERLAAPALALVALAGLAYGLRRRKQRLGSSIRVIEAASLGDKRSLVIADVLGERLVLGVSEAGVAVLLNRPAPASEVEEEEQASPTEPALGFFARLRGRPAAPAFDDALQESIEDQELRAKLAAGVRSVVP